MEYNIHNGPIRWQNINLYKSHIWAVFACSHHFRAIYIKNLENVDVQHS